MVVHFLVNLFKNRLNTNLKKNIYIYVYVFDNNPRFLFVWVNILDWLNQLIIDSWEVTQTKVWSSPRIRFTHAVSLITLLLHVFNNTWSWVILDEWGMCPDS